MPHKPKIDPSYLYEFQMELGRGEQKYGRVASRKPPVDYGNPDLDVELSNSSGLGGEMGYGGGDAESIRSEILKKHPMLGVQFSSEFIEHNPAAADNAIARLENELRKQYRKRLEKLTAPTMTAPAA